jgi:hypothetical protein
LGKRQDKCLDDKREKWRNLKMQHGNDEEKILEFYNFHANE